MTLFSLSPVLRSTGVTLSGIRSYGKKLETTFRAIGTIDLLVTGAVAACCHLVYELGYSTIGRREGMNHLGYHFSPIRFCWFPYCGWHPPIMRDKHVRNIEQLIAEAVDFAFSTKYTATRFT